MEQIKAAENEQTDAATVENNNSDLITDLGEFIAYLESHPGIPKIGSVTIPVLTWGKQEFIDAMRTMGAGEKEYENAYIRFHRKFGRIDFYAWGLRNEVCQKVQVGTKVVKTFELKPEFKHAEIGTYVDKEEPVYEWECPGSLLAEVHE